MGFFGSFWGTDQRRDISNANKQATRQLEQGYGQQQQRYDQAYGLYDPYIQQGTKANTFYGDALGLNGADAQKAAYGNINANPMFQNMLNQDNNTAMRMLNARGNSGGAADLAAARVFQQNMGNWLDRYNDQGQRGLVSAQQGANVRMGQGDNAMGYGATRANQAINYGNALASTRNIGINNLLNVANAAASFVNPMAGIGRALSGVTSQPGTAANGGFATTTTPNNLYNRIFG